MNSTRVFQDLIRLQKAGCPLDLSRLPDVAAPHRLQRTGPGAIYAVEGGTAFVLPARITATAAFVSITRLQLMADWLSEEVRWSSPAGQEFGEWLAEARCGIDPLDVVSYRLLRPSAGLQRGAAVNGVLFGIAYGLNAEEITLPSTAIHWVRDQFGDLYHHEVAFEKKLQVRVGSFGTD